MQVHPFFFRSEFEVMNQHAPRTPPPTSDKIDFSAKAFVVTLAFVAVEAVAAYFEGALTPGGTQSVTLSFMAHGGALYDLLFFPIIVGLVWRHLRFNATRVAVGLTIAATITVLMHLHWYHTNHELRVTDWVWPSLESSHWLKDMGWAGVLHCLFMTTGLLLAFCYLFSPVPAPNVKYITALLTLFPFVGTLLPESMTRQSAVSLPGIAIATAILITTWLVAAIKVRQHDRLLR